jgi:hypothetical protein
MTRYTIEIKLRGDKLSTHFFGFQSWTLRNWKSYATEKQRDQALIVLNKKDTLFQYRAGE